ncbi:F-box only protein 36 isoform X3 [Cavia porcellus]|uniref:F-box only protein 36 isoform X3 n=1 Tax=Cavia porcellus TaxID=10141 RepID=UPI000661EF51
MASWLPETLYETVGQGPAPSKDYYQLLVTRSQIIFRWWKISLRSEYRSARPGESKDTHEDFLDDSHLQGQEDTGIQLQKERQATPKLLCKSDVLWEQIVQSACGTITPDMRTLAEDMGWRQMFFTNKLQLQRQLRKRRQRQGSQQQTVILESSEKHRGSAHNCSRTWSPGPFLNRLCPPQMPKPGPGTWAGRQKASQITMFPTLLTPPPNPQERSFLYV